MTYVPTVPLARANACWVNLHYTLHCPTPPCYSQFGVPSPLHRTHMWMTFQMTCDATDAVTEIVLKLQPVCFGFISGVWTARAWFSRVTAQWSRPLQLPWPYSDDRKCILNVTSKIFKYTIGMLHLLQFPEAVTKLSPDIQWKWGREGRVGDDTLFV